MGEDVARSSPWSRSLDWPLEDPFAPRDPGRGRTTDGRGADRSRAQANAYTDRERDLIRGLALYLLYYRYDSELYQLITPEPPAETVEFFNRFDEDFRDLFELV